jgi:hypothetical protein
MAQILDLGKFRFDFKGVYSGATEYERNDVVQYGGNVYVYTLGTASTGNLPTDDAFWELMVEGFNYRSTWSVSTQYLLSDVVSYGGKVYIALQDTLGDDPVSSTSDWAVLVDGIQYEGEWSSSTAYQKGDVVKYGGNIWIALANSTNTIPVTGATWEILVYGVEYKGAYNPSTAYKINDIITFGGKSYIALQASTGTTPVEGATWALFSSGFQFEGEWSSLTSYQSGDVVNYGGLVYVAIANSLASAPTDPLYWAVLIEGIAWKGTYNALTTYNKNDIVSYGGSSWVAKQNTTGNTPETGANWDILAAGTFPDYSSAAGKFLSNDGTDIIWVSDVTVDVLTAEDKIYVGPDAEQVETDIALTNAAGVFVFNNGSEDELFAQIAFKNVDPTSSTDLIVYSDNGGDSYGWASFGITGHDFGDPLFPLTGANDAYIFHDAPLEVTFTVTDKELTSNVATLTVDETIDPAEVYVGSTVTVAGVDSTFNGTYKVTAVNTEAGTISYSKTASNVESTSASGTAVTNGGSQGNLVFATGSNGSDNKIIFAAGGFSSGNTQMEITPDVNVHIEIPTPSTNPSTGAFTVVGGVGIQGDMNIQGDVAIVGTISFGGSGTTVTTANLAVDAPIIFSGTNNVDDLIDLGQVGEFTVLRESPIIASVSNKSLTSNIATLTTSSAHGFSVGQVVVVTDVDATFNGTHVITSLASTTFTFSKEAANVSSTAVSPTGTATVTRDRKYAGIVRDATDGIVKVFTGASTKPGTTVNFSEAGLTFASIKVGALEASTLTATTGVTSTAGTNALKDLTLSGTSNTFGTSTIAGNYTVTGNPTYSGTPVFSGSPSFTGTPTFTGGIRVQEMVEDVVDVTLSSNVATLDYSVGNIFFTTNTPSAAMTWNITNAPTTDGRVFTINVLVTQGSTGYIPTLFSINGSAVTMRWAGGTAPTPTSSSGKIDIFTLNFVRRASAYTLLGSANLNF